MNVSTGSPVNPISAIKGSKDGALASAFVDYVLSSEGQKVLQTAGFAKA